MNFVKQLIASQGTERFTCLLFSSLFFSFFRIGSVQMVSKDAATLDKDYQTIRDLESHGFFVLQ
jgi:hypothetical protein